MILLWGLEEDTPMQMVHAELLAAKASFFYLDHRAIFNSEIEYSFDENKQENCTLKIEDKILDLQNIRAAYCRPYNFREYHEAMGKPDDDPIILKASGFQMQLMAYLDASNALIVNRTGPSATNNSKPLQLSLIKQAGFNIPETFVTNSVIQAKEFLSRHPNAVFKSISGQRSIVEKFSLAHHQHLDDIQWCPTLFQQIIPGLNYRVHILHNEVFSTRIESDSLDYRYGNTRMAADLLPTNIAEMCRKVTADLGLSLAGIDLIRTPDDDWYCLEVNPSPAYSYFQNHTGQPISSALARMLMAA